MSTRVLTIGEARVALTRIGCQVRMSSGQLDWQRLLNVNQLEARVNKKDDYSYVATIFDTKNGGGSMLADMVYYWIDANYVHRAAPTNRMYWQN